MTGAPFFKPRHGDRLRAKYAAKIAEARALADLYKAVYKRDGYRCVACKRHVVVGSVDELKRAHPHHIVRRSDPSPDTHTTGNVCCLCAFCHADVGDRTLIIRGNADLGLSIWRVAP
jgi:5-methylcytosine-specific restriction endonuclease McrA